MSNGGRRPASGKRAHYKAERLGCREMIDQMLAAGHTLDEILDAVRAKGEEIGRTSIWRYANAWERTAERFRRAREQAQVLIQAVREGGATDLAEVANGLLMQGIVERLNDHDAEEYKKLPLDKVGRIVADLERSGVGRERLKLELRQRAEEVVKNVEERVGSAGLDDDTRRFIREQIYGLVD